MKKKVVESLEPPIAPLIDVIFLLIMFFIVTSSVEKASLDSRIKLTQCKFFEVKELNKKTLLVVNILENGEFSLGEGETINEEMLKQKLKDFIQNTPKDLGDIQIAIRADKYSLTKNSHDLIEIIKLLGVNNIIVYAKKE